QRLLDDGLVLARLEAGAELSQREIGVGVAKTNDGAKGRRLGAGSIQDILRDPGGEVGAHQPAAEEPRLGDRRGSTHGPRRSAALLWTGRGSRGEQRIDLRRVEPRHLRQAM